MKFLFAFLLFLSFTVSANECLREVNKYCMGVEKGKGQIARCLSDYEANLSPACVNDLNEFKKNTAKKNPCFEELADYCANVPSLATHYEFCLLKNESRLGSKCAADFKKKKVTMLSKNKCANDIVNICYEGVTAPVGSIQHCLIKNMTKLTPDCQVGINRRITEMKKNNYCYEDTSKFCPTKIKFIDIQDCLAKKLPVLESKCKVLVEQQLTAMGANPCYRELLKHCKPNLSPKEQTECLTLNDDHLGKSCKEYRLMESSRVKKMEEVCEDDRLKLCKDAPFKDGAITKCLRGHKLKVTPACAKFL